MTKDYIRQINPKTSANIAQKITLALLNLKPVPI